MTEVWAGLATLLDRTSRPEMIESLLPQVDRLTINTGRELGDSIKFASCEDAPGYFFTVDDDLVYPETFVETTLRGLERHPGCIVGYHGWNIDRDGVRTHEYAALADVEDDERVHVLGTLACAFHVDTIRPTLADFPMHMADVWLAIKAARENVPLIVLAHDADFFGYLPPEQTMWDETQNQTGSPLDASHATRAAIEQLVELHYGIPV